MDSHFDAIPEDSNIVEKTSLNVATVWKLSLNRELIKTKTLSIETWLRSRLGLDQDFNPVFLKPGVATHKCVAKIFLCVAKYTVSYLSRIS
jgi:hypothetical protein